MHMISHSIELFPSNWIKQKVPRIAHSFREVYNSWQPEQVIEDQVSVEDLVQGLSVNFSLFDCILS